MKHLLALILFASVLSAATYTFNNNQMILNAVQTYTNTAGETVQAVAIKESSITNWNLSNVAPNVDLNSLFTITNLVISVTESNYFERWEYYVGSSESYWTNLSYYGNLTNTAKVIILNTMKW